MRSPDSRRSTAGGQIYFRFSHVFLDRPEIKGFWWEMAREEEEHECILHACKAIANYDDETLDPSAVTRLKRSKNGSGPSCSRRPVVT
jgi:hypothetical protein